MSVITLASSKGGAGKTTIAQIIISSALAQGKTTAVIDGDLNHSLSEWISSFDIKADVHQELDEKMVFARAAELSDQYDIVIIDTAGSAGRSTLFAMAQSNLVIIPLQPSRQDLTEATKTLRMIDRAGKVTSRTIEARLLLNSFNPKTLIAQHVLEEIEKNNLPAFKTQFHPLTAFREMSFNGEAPSRWTAGVQVRSFLRELDELGVLSYYGRSVFGRLVGRSA